MKKILAVVVALTMVMALAVPAFAVEGSVTVKIYSQNSANWSTPKSEAVTIDHAGEYTLVLEGDDVSFAPDLETFKLLYIKDVEVEENGATTSAISDYTLTVKSVKMNGVECVVKEGYTTGLTDDGTFDCALINGWVEGATYIEFVDGIDDPITKVEIVIEIADAAPSAEAAPAADAATADTTPAESPETGLALAVIPAVAAMAAAVITKRR